MPQRSESGDDAVSSREKTPDALESLVFPVLGVTRDAAVVTFPDAGPLRRTSAERVKRRFFEQLLLMDSRGAVFRVAGLSVERQRVPGWARLIRWLWTEEVGVTLDLGRAEATEPLELFRTAVLQALYDRPDYYETVWPLHQWVRRVARVRSAGEMAGLFTEFPADQW